MSHYLVGNRRIPDYKVIGFIYGFKLWKTDPLVFMKSDVEKEALKLRKKMVKKSGVKPTVVLNSFEELKYFRDN